MLCLRWLQLGEGLSEMVDPEPSSQSPEIRRRMSCMCGMPLVSDRAVRTARERGRGQVQVEAGRSLSKLAHPAACSLQDETAVLLKCCYFAPRREDGLKGMTTWHNLLHTEPQTMRRHLFCRLPRPFCCRQVLKLMFILSPTRANIHNASQETSSRIRVRGR